MILTGLGALLTRTEWEGKGRRGGGEGDDGEEGERARLVESKWK